MTGPIGADLRELADKLLAGTGLSIADAIAAAASPTAPGGRTDEPADQPADELAARPGAVVAALRDGWCTAQEWAS